MPVIETDGGYMYVRPCIAGEQGQGMVWLPSPYTAISKWLNDPNYRKYRQQELNSLKHSNNMETIIQESLIEDSMIKEAFDYARKVEQVDRFTVAQAYLDGRKRNFMVAVDLANTETSKQVKGEYLSVEKDEDGNVTGVRVTGLGESFVVALKDCDKEMDWYEACKNNAPSKKQALIMNAVAKELSDLLEANGGERIDDGKWRWTKDEYYGNIAWLYIGNVGRLTYYTKHDSDSVRPVLA